MNGQEAPLHTPSRRVPLLLPALALALGIASGPLLRPFATSLALATMAAGVLALLVRRTHPRASASVLSATVIAATLAVAPLLGVADLPPDPRALSKTPIARHADDTLPPQLARFARAVILNDLEGLEDADRIAYRRSGLTHLLAISGVNVAIMALLFRLLLAPLPLPRAARELGAAAAVAVYIAGIGAPPSALRAGIMAIAVFIARARGRTSDTLNILFGAAFLTLLIDPIALYDPGFQLSYAATVGLILWTRPLQAVLPSRPRLLGPLVAGSVAAQALTLPIVAWHFAELAPIGFVANLAAIPLFALLFPLTVLALIGLPGALPPAASLLEILTGAIDAFARLPGATFAIARPPLPAVFALLGLGLIPLVAAVRHQRLAFTALIAMLALSLATSGRREGTWVVADETGRLGIIHAARENVTILDGGLRGLSWKRALAELGITRVTRVQATTPAALNPGGVRRLAEFLDVAAWEVPSPWMRNPEHRWVLARLAAAGRVETCSDSVPLLQVGATAYALADTPPRPGTIAVAPRGRFAALLRGSGVDRVVRFPADSGGRAAL